MIKGLFTKSVQAKKPKADAPSSSPSAASESTAPVIIKDVHYNEMGGSTIIEVRTDGIHLHNENDNLDEFFPLNQDNHIDELSRIREDMRCQIAKKLSLLVPNLSQQQHSEVLDYTVGILDTFAQDQEVRVRRIIAQELKSSTTAPPQIIERLVWDTDIQVCGPILEYSPLLGEHELLDIIASSPVEGALEAIAKRPRISENISEALVRAENINATKALLENETAEMNDAILEFVVRRAPEHEEWHRPLMTRQEVSLRTLNRIASFVSQSIVLELLDKGLIPEEVGSHLNLAVNNRLKNIRLDREKEAQDRVNQLAAFGLLDAEALSDELEKGEFEFVLAALSHLSQLPMVIVHRMFSTKNPRAITALCWRAGMPMRLSIRLQLKKAQIPHPEVLNAKEGFDYPMTEGEMTAYLKYFAG